MTGHIGKNHVGRGGNNHRSDGQAIQTVGKIHGVRGSDNDKSCKNDISPAKIRRNIFKKGYGNLGRKVGADVNQKTGNQSDDGLPHQFSANAQSFALLFNLHQIVVYKSDQSVPDDHKQCDPYIKIG